MLVGAVIGLAIFLSVAMAVAWQVVLRTGNSGWADAFWSYAIGVAGVAGAIWPLSACATPGARAWIAVALVAVWSLRLGTHILERTLKGGDDPRYAQLKSEWGSAYRGKLLMFLEIQAGAALVLALSVMAAANNPAPLGVFDGVAILVAIIAIAGEAVSDAQLTAFRRDPANQGEVCDTGLWSLSRHPNYFFEWLGWVAYPLLAIGHAWFFFALLAPVLMYVLLVHVSGIPPLEAHMLRSRPQAFRDYQARVNPFWPLPKTGARR